MASRPLEGGGSLAPKSFKEALAGGSAPPGKVNVDYGEFRGVPAVFISDVDMLSLAKPYALTLIGKFVVNRPPVELIRKFVLRLKLFGNVLVDNHDKFNVVFRFSDERDYIRFFVRRFYKVLGIDMKVVKWSPFSDISEELPVVPLWISLPGLRYQLFHKNTLFDIAKIYGKPLSIDSATFSHGNMSRARVLVEIDISVRHPEKIWIGSRESGVFQQVIIENLPNFCGLCKSCGHLALDCPARMELQPVCPSSFHGLGELAAHNVQVEVVAHLGPQGLDGLIPEMPSKVVENLGAGNSCNPPEDSCALPPLQTVDCTVEEGEFVPSNLESCVHAGEAFIGMPDGPLLDKTGPLFPAGAENSVASLGENQVLVEMPVCERQSEVLLEQCVVLAGEGSPSKAWQEEFPSLPLGPRELEEAPTGKLLSFSNVLKFGNLASPPLRKTTRSMSKLEGRGSEGGGWSLSRNGKKLGPDGPTSVVLDAITNPPSFNV